MKDFTNDIANVDGVFRVYIHPDLDSCGHSSLAITVGSYAGADVMDEMDVEIINRLPSPVWRDDAQTEAMAPQPADQESARTKLFSAGSGWRVLSM